MTLSSSDLERVPLEVVEFVVESGAMWRLVSSARLFFEYGCESTSIVDEPLLRFVDARDDPSSTPSDASDSEAVDSSPSRQSGCFVR